LNKERKKEIHFFYKVSLSFAAEMERGNLRSGTRFAARNLNYYPTVKELLDHHKRLLSHQPAITTRATRIAGLNFGSLLQTTVRFRFDSTIIKSTLRAVFFNLFREHTPGADTGFEVVVTFNAILASSAEQNTYSLFYGHDHRADNLSGAAPELKYGSTTVVRFLSDVDSIPTSFDQEALIASHRRAFESSNVRVHQFVNIVYLIYRFVDTNSTVSERRKAEKSKSRDAEPSTSANFYDGGSLSKKRS
jgi:hypothetical protein